jgi:hypothetical protein
LPLPATLLQFLAAILLLSFGSPVLGQTTKALPGSVTIRPRKITIQRSAAVTRHAPNRKSAVIVLPVVTGISDSAILARVRSELDIQNVFGSTLQDYREDTWLDDFGYKVNYNADYLLDITFTQNGLAAYPDTHEKQMLISLRDGKLVKAADVFEVTNLESLAALVDRALQAELAKLRAENLADVRDNDERQALTDAYSNLKIERENLDEFSVGKTGITFLYDAGFPHVIKALEPHGRYFFSYRALSDYIRRDGPLGKFRN